MSGRNLSAEILTFFNFLFFWGGGKGGEKGWGEELLSITLEKENKRTKHCAGKWGMPKAQHPAAMGWGTWAEGTTEPRLWASRLVGIQTSSSGEHPTSTCPEPHCSQPTLLAQGVKPTHFGAQHPSAYCPLPAT